jgi:hypothetical protein
MQPSILYRLVWTTPRSLSIIPEKICATSTCSLVTLNSHWQWALVDPTYPSYAAVQPRFLAWFPGVMLIVDCSAWVHRELERMLLRDRGDSFGMSSAWCRFDIRWCQIDILIPEFKTLKWDPQSQGHWPWPHVELETGHFKGTPAPFHNSTTGHEYQNSQLPLHLLFPYICCECSSQKYIESKYIQIHNVQYQ